MPTVHLPPSDELPPEKREALERVARRAGTVPDELALIHRTRLHWPEYIETAAEQGRHEFKGLRTLPEMTKQGIHVAVSMVNRCEY